MDPNLLRSLPLPTGPAVIIFQAGDYEVGGGMVLKVLYQRGGETTFPNVMEVLREPGVNRMFGFAYVVFMAECACYDVYYVGGNDGGRT